MSPPARPRDRVARVCAAALAVALAAGCQRACTAGEPPASGGATSSSAAAPVADAFELALAEHFPSGVAFSPDGRQLATLGHHEVVVWDAESGAPVHVLAGEGTDLEWSADGHRIAVASSGSVRVVDLGDETFTLPLVAGESNTKVSGLTWISNAEVAAMLGTGELARMVDAKPTARFRVFARPIAFAVWDGSRARLAVAPEEPALPLEIASGADFGTRQTLTWEGRDHVVLALRFSPDGTKLAGLDNRVGNGVKIWDLGTRQPLPAPRAPATRVDALAWSPDSSRLALASESVHVVKVSDGSESRSRPLRGWPGEGVAWSPDGRTLAVSWRALTLHDAENLEPKARIWVPPDDMTRLACARSADALIGTSREGDLVEWNLTTGGMRSIPGLAADALRVDWVANDEKWVVVSKREVRLFDAKSAKPLGTLALELPASELDLPSPDAKWLAEVRMREAQVADAGPRADAAEALPPDLPPAPEVEEVRGGIGLGALVSGRPHLLLRPLAGGPLRDFGVVAAAGSLAFSSDAKRVAVITDRGLEVFDVASGRAVARITTPAHGLGPMGSRQDPFGALSPDGSELVSAGPSYSELEVWSVATGKRLRHFRGFGGAPLVWAGDGSSIASSGLWYSADDGHELAAAHVGPNAVTCIGPNGHFISSIARSDIAVVRKDRRELRLQRVPVRLEWRPFAWQADGHFDADEETSRRVWLVPRGGKPSPAAEQKKLKQPGLVAEFVKGAG